VSAREDLAQRIADVIVQHRLTSPYGGDVNKAGNHYSVLFSTPRVLDGVVNVYGPKFIQVTYQTQYRDLPNRDNRVFESEQATVEFIEAAFVAHDFQRAVAIPTKAK
jgi:hypothetical protein